MSKAKKKLLLAALVAAVGAFLCYRALTNNSSKNTAEEVQAALSNAQGEVTENLNYERFQGRITPYSKKDFPNIDERTYYIFCEKLIEFVDKGDPRPTPHPIKFPKGEILVNGFRKVNPKYIFIQPGINPDKYYEVGIQFREEGGNGTYVSMTEFKGNIKFHPYAAGDHRR